MYNLGHRIRSIRKQRSLTIEALAQLSGLSKGYISKIENNTQNPAVSTLQKLACWLNCDISALLDEPKQGKGINGLEVVLPGDFEMQVQDDSYSNRRLVHTFRGKYMTPFTMSVQPGKTTPQFTHDSEECIYVIKGTIELLYGKNSPVVLPEGASAYIDAREAHSFRNVTEEPVLLFTVNFNYRRF